MREKSSGVAFEMGRLTLFMIVSLMIAAVIFVQYLREEPQIQGIELIERKGSSLVGSESGAKFRFVGGNHFNLLVKYLWGEFHGMTGEEVFQTSEDNGIKVLRFWATCSNGYWSDQCLYFGPNNWKNQREDFFEKFDQLVADAERHEIYLIPVLTDGYYTFQWMGSMDATNATQVCEVGKDANMEYKRFVDDVVGRYRERDIILMWEIGNEGHRSCDGFDDLVSWYEDSADYIKAIDERHLVSTGEDNFGSMDEDSFIEVHAIENIDVASVHIYDTDLYKLTNVKRTAAVDRYVSYWTSIAHDQLGMPIYFGEFGVYDIAANPDFYGEGLEAAKTHGSDGLMVWSWLEGSDCSQSVEENGGSCITPERTPSIVEDISSNDI